MANNKKNPTVFGNLNSGKKKRSKKNEKTCFLPISDTCDQNWPSAASEKMCTIISGRLRSQNRSKKRDLRTTLGPVNDKRCQKAHI